MKNNEISWETYPDPMPGKTYKTFIYKGDKKIGYLLFNAWAMEPEVKIITNEARKSSVVAVLHRIEIANKCYRGRGIASAVLKDWLKGFERVDTGVDSNAGLNLILKCGFKTGDGINYIWEDIDAKDEKGKEDNSADEKNIR